MEPRRTATACRLPYGITHLLQDISEHTPPGRQVGTRFTYPRRMER